MQFGSVSSLFNMQKATKKAQWSTDIIEVSLNPTKLSLNLRILNKIYF